MSVEDNIKKYAEAWAKKLLDPKWAKEDAAKVEDITISSLSELKDKLQIKDIDTSTLEELKNPIKFTKEELEKLKADMLGTNVDKLTKLKEIIKSKIEVSQKTNASIADFKAAMATWWFAWISTYASKELSAKMEDAQNAEWIDKFSKLWELFEWWKDLYKKITSYIAVKIPFLANLFWWKNEYPELADAKKKWEEVLDTAKDKAEEATTAAKDKTNWVLSEEQLKAEVEKKKVALKDELKNKWWEWWEAKFEKVWKKHEAKIIENTKKAASMTKDKDGYYALDIPLLYWQESVEFMSDLVKEWIIPKEAIVAKVKEWTTRVIEFWISSVYDALGLSVKGASAVLWKISLDEFWKDYANLEKHQKVLLWEMLYHKGILLTYMMWLTSSIALNCFVIPVTWHERTWWTWVKQSFGASMWKFDQVAKWYEELLSQLWISETTPLVAKLRSNLVEWYAKSIVTHIYKESSNDVQKFQTLLKEAKMICPTWNEKIDLLINQQVKWHFDKLITETWKLSTSSNFSLQEFLQKEIKNSWWSTESLTFWWKVKRPFAHFFKWTTADPIYYVDESSVALKWTSEALSEIIRNDWSKIWGIMSELKTALKFPENASITTKAIASLDKWNINRVWELASRLLQESPSLARWFFNNLSIVIITAWLVENDWIDIANFAKSMMVFFPWFDVYWMAREWTKVEHWSLVQYGFIWWSAVLAGMHIHTLIWILNGWNKVGWLLRFVWRPITAPIEFAGWVIRSWSYLMEVVPWIIKAWEAWETAKVWELSRRWIWTAAVIWVLMLSYKLWRNWYKDMNEEQLIAKLRESKIIDANWELVPDMIKEWLSNSKINKEQKELIARLLAKNAMTWNMVNIPWIVPEIKRKYDAKLVWNSNEIEFRFHDGATKMDQDMIKNYLVKFWFNPRFVYTNDAITEIVKELKNKWISKQEYLLGMRELWIKDNLEKYWVS